MPRIVRSPLWRASGSTDQYRRSVDSEESEELARVSEKYAPMRIREVLLWVAAIAVMAIVSRYRDVSWFFFAGMAGAAVIWEVTKLRLRHNAQSYAQAAGRR
jgi:hypothetical protein